MADTDWDIKPQYGVPARVSPQTAITLANMLRQSVPTGEDGDTRSALQRYSDAYDQADQPSPLSKALLTYGDKVLVPPLKDIPAAIAHGTVDALNTAGDYAMAYGPPDLGPAGPVAMTLGMMLKAPRAALSAISGRAPVVKAAPETLESVGNEIAALTQQGKQFGIAPGPRPDIPLSPDEELNMLQSIRDTMKPQIQARQAALDATNAAAPRTSVPNADGLTPIRERNQVLDTIQGNPYVQPIPGRQGFPTKQDQVSLAQQFFDNGGRLSAGGPWGRDMQAEIKNVLSQAAKKVDNQSTGPVVNMPGVPQIMEAAKDYKGQALQARQDLQQEVLKRYQQTRNLRNDGDN